MSTEAPM